MAKKGRAAEQKRGPYLAAALLCQMILEDKDGPLSAIRIVDQFSYLLHPDTPPEIPSETHRFPVEFHTLLSFKTGDAPGDYTLRLVLETPSGESKQTLEQSITLNPIPHGGHNIRIPTVIMAKENGLYQLHVSLDDKRITSIPFQVSIQRGERPAPSQQSDGTVSSQKRRPRK